MRVVRVFLMVVVVLVESCNRCASAVCDGASEAWWILLITRRPRILRLTCVLRKMVETSAERSVMVTSRRV